MLAHEGKKKKAFAIRLGKSSGRGGGKARKFKIKKKTRRFRGSHRYKEKGATNGGGLRKRHNNRL